MNYTTIEQSKKLIELGLDASTADMYYPDMYYPEYDLIHSKIPLFMGDDFYSDSDIPCWSLGALLEVMPKNIYGPRPKDHPTEFMFTPRGLCYFDWTGMQPGPYYDTNNGYITAAFNMMVWLLENDYIK